jgi:hypothetical protein
MKCSTPLAKWALIWASTNIGTVTSFAPTSHRHIGSPPSSSLLVLLARPTDCARREVLDAAATGLAALLLAATAAAAAPALAEQPRPMYLTEPTDEFKANEARAMEFKRQQLAVKRDFNAIVETFLAEGNIEEKLVAELQSMKALIAKTGGLPLGVKKDELFKMIRSKKAKGYWPTPVEIAYQSLIQEISFQQSPNLDKELGNPYQ